MVADRQNQPLRIILVAYTLAWKLAISIETRPNQVRSCCLSARARRRKLTIFFYFYFLISIYNLVGYDRLEHLYIHKKSSLAFIYQFFISILFYYF